MGGARGLAGRGSAPRSVDAARTAQAYWSLATSILLCPDLSDPVPQERAAFFASRSLRPCLRAPRKRARDARAALHRAAQAERRARPAAIAAALCVDLLPAAPRQQP